MPRRPLFGSVKARSSWIAAGVLVIVALLGLLTDLFRSPRSVVTDAAGNLATVSDADIRFVVDVRAPRDSSGRQYHHLNFRAGPGPLVRPENEPIKVSFPFTMTLERRGSITFFRGSTIIERGAGYIKFDELPAYGNLGELLTDRWLQVGEPREEPGRVLTREEGARLVGQLLAPDILIGVHRGSAERVRSVRARAYRLEFNEDRLRALFGEIAEQVPDHAGVATTARYLASRLENNRIDLAQVWIRPQSHDLVRARLELVPKTENAPIERLVIDVTVLPRESGDVPQAPERAVRLRQETIQRIFSP